MYLSLDLYGLKEVTQGLRVRGSWWPNINCNILTPTLMTLNVVSFSFSWYSTEGPGVHSAAWWLSLLHLISNFSGPQTPLGFPKAPSARCGFPYHISSITPSPNVNATVTWLLSWLRYIIVQRPLDRPLDLWNGMIDRHPAEINVMQFTGHSLPVHQSMSVSWALTCPILSTKSTHASDYWNVSLPTGASICNGMFARAEGQNTTQGCWGVICTKHWSKTQHKSRCTAACIPSIKPSKTVKATLDMN